MCSIRITFTIDLLLILNPFCKILHLPRCPSFCNFRDYSGSWQYTCTSDDVTSSSNYCEKGCKKFRHFDWSKVYLRKVHVSGQKRPATTLNRCTSTQLLFLCSKLQIQQLLIEGAHSHHQRIGPMLLGLVDISHPYPFLQEMTS